MKRCTLLVLALVLCLAATPAAAQAILYIPADDRPVNLDYVVDTARAAGLDILTPPRPLLGSRSAPGCPEGLWRWLFAEAPAADAVVASADALLYGSLVASRTHDFPAAVLAERLQGFARLKAANPGLRLYVFSTIMRTPQASAGGTEPDYYETYGPSIFRITALRDKAETAGLTRGEDAELKDLLAHVPAGALADWHDRREKNLRANFALISYVRDGTFSYLVQGRDDCSPYSRSHQESRPWTR